MFSYKSIVYYYPFKRESYLKFIKENIFIYFKYLKGRLNKSLVMLKLGVKRNVSPSFI
jgi:hypothetical protein